MIEGIKSIIESIVGEPRRDSEGWQEHIGFLCIEYNCLLKDYLY